MDVTFTNQGLLSLNLCSTRQRRYLIRFQIFLVFTKRLPLKINPLNVVSDHPRRIRQISITLWILCLNTDGKPYLHWMATPNYSLQQIINAQSPLLGLQQNSRQQYWHSHGTETPSLWASGFSDTHKRLGLSKILFSEIIDGQRVRCPLLAIRLLVLSDFLLRVMAILLSLSFSLCQFFCFPTSKY